MARTATARSEEPSMDEILASIREIIAEAPLDTRHRPPVSKSLLNSDIDLDTIAVAAGASMTSLRQRRPVTAAGSATVVTSDVAVEDILAGLLVPTEDRPENGPVGANLELAAPSSGGQRHQDADGHRPDDRARPSRELPDARPTVVTVSTIAAKIIDGPAPAHPPEDEIKTAEAALGALAAGLAAFASPAACGPEPEATPALPEAAASANTEPSKSITRQGEAEPAARQAQAIEDAPLSPAETAAEAIAAVAAAEAAQHGLPSSTTEDVASGEPVAAANVDDVQEAVAPTADPLSEVSGVATSLSTVRDATPVGAVTETDALVQDCGSGASFEDTIAGMLRPLLREWLDTNMPRMVEKALKDDLAPPPLEPAESLSTAGNKTP